MVVRIHPREPPSTMKHTPVSVSLLLAAVVVTSCRKGDDTSSSSTANEAAQRGLECDHDLEANSVVKHSWPYPAELRDLRWGARYSKVKLRLKPVHAAFVTATVTLRAGDLVEVEDSYIRITKPRRLVAKRDVVVRRKVWDQGVQVERSMLAAKGGEVGSFLFYNSRGMCLVGTEEGPGWTPCSLQDTFEGLSAEDPHPCASEWWVRVRKSSVDNGWMLVDESVTQRVPRPDAAK